MAMDPQPLTRMQKVARRSLIFGRRAVGPALRGRPNRGGTVSRRLLRGGWGKRQATQAQIDFEINWRRGLGWGVVFHGLLHSTVIVDDGARLVAAVPAPFRNL